MPDEKNKPLHIATQTIHPGESISLALPLPEAFTCAPIYMPIKIIHGKKAGPCILVIAALHGDELNGTEIINQLLKKLSSKKISGTLIAIPVFNVYALINRSRTLPGGVNIDLHFPGSEHGTHAERMTHVFVKEIFSHADICIDLQTGLLNHSNLPQIYTDFNDPRSKQLALQFHAPVVSMREPQKGSLHALAKENNKPFLLYTAGQAMHFDAQAIKVGVKGLEYLLYETNMLARKQESDQKAKEQQPLLSKTSISIRAPKSGVSHSQHTIGDIIKKNDVVSIIKDPFGTSEDLPVKSPADGIIIGKNNLPLTYEGATIFELAIFDALTISSAAHHIKTWSKKQKMSKDEESKNE